MLAPRKILIGDDHQLIRKGIRNIIERHFSNLEIVEASSCSQIFNQLKQSKFTHCFFDMVLGDGTILEVLPHFVRPHSRLPILIYSMQPAVIYKKVLFDEFRIQYYLSKSSDEELTKQLMIQFLRNEPLHDPDILLSPATPFSDLSARELEILYYVLQGEGSFKIATLLNITASTVSTYKSRIMEKTKTENIAQLIRLADAYAISC